jgi:hypothetical protein
MTPQNKRLAVLLGEALTVVAVRYVLTSRNDSEAEDVVARRQRHVWIHAIAAEATSFLIDQIILQRRRAEAAIERASIAATLPSAEPAARTRLPRQPRQSSSTIEA